MQSLVPYRWYFAAVLILFVGAKVVFGETPDPPPLIHDDPPPLANVVSPVEVQPRPFVVSMGNSMSLTAASIVAGSSLPKAAADLSPVRTGTFAHAAIHGSMTTNNPFVRVCRT